MGRESSLRTKELINLPPLVLVARHLGGSAFCTLFVGLGVPDRHWVGFTRIWDCCRRWTFWTFMYLFSSNKCLPIYAPGVKCSEWIVKLMMVLKHGAGCRPRDPLRSILMPPTWRWVGCGPWLVIVFSVFIVPSHTNCRLVIVTNLHLAIPIAFCTWDCLK